jgi:hypothetical protein
MVADPSSSPGNGRAPSPPHETPAEAFEHLGVQLNELRSHVAYLVSAKIDGIVIGLRNAGIYAALGVVGLIALGAIVVTSVVLLLSGLAGAVSAMFDTSAWVGELIIGLVVLGLLAGATLFGLSWITKRSRQRTVDKYERKRNEQRAEFDGRDVHDRATTTPTASGHVDG